MLKRHWVGLSLLMLVSFLTVWLFLKPFVIAVSIIFALSAAKAVEMRLKRRAR